MKGRSHEKLLFFAEELEEILKEADDNDDKGAGHADKKKPSKNGESGVHESVHRWIVNEPGTTEGRDGEFAVCLRSMRVSMSGLSAMLHALRTGYPDISARR